MTVSSFSLISKAVEKSIEQHGWTFSLQSEILTAEEVAAQDCFLPLLLEEVHETLSQISFDVKAEQSNTPLVLFEKPIYQMSSEAMCQAIPDEEAMLTWKLPLTLLSIDFVLERQVKEYPLNFKQGEPVPLDNLLEKYIQKYENNQVQFKAPKVQPVSSQTN